MEGEENHNSLTKYKEYNNFVLKNYSNRVYEKNVNHWLDQQIIGNKGNMFLVEDSSYIIPYTNDDFVYNFYEKILELVQKNNYKIFNENAFKDDIIRFLYKYSNGKSRVRPGGY